VAGRNDPAIGKHRAGEVHFASEVKSEMQQPGIMSFTARSILLFVVYPSGRLKAGVAGTDFLTRI
jgi:hypothetical protein